MKEGNRPREGRGRHADGIARLLGALILMLLMLLAPAPASAQSESFGPWRVDNRAAACTLIRYYDEDRLLLIMPLRSGDRVGVSIYDPNLKTIVDGEQYDAQLDLYAGARRGPRWGALKMPGMIVGPRRGVGLIVDRASFFEALIRSTRLHLTRGSATIADLSLDGDLETAVEHLQRCAQSRAAQPATPAD